jgi:hypothetical protein
MTGVKTHETPIVEIKLKVNQYQIRLLKEQERKMLMTTRRNHPKKVPIEVP